MYISSAYTTRKTDYKHTAVSAPDVKDILSEDIDFYLLLSDIVEFLTPELSRQTKLEP